MANLKQSTAYVRMFKMIASSDHISLKTSAAPTVNISKAGAAFGAAGGAVAEVASGWYKVTLSTTDTNTLGDLAFYITGTSSDDTDFCDQVTANILGDNLPVTSNVKKNQALAAYPFVMTDSSTHAPATGLTVAVTRSINGAAFGAGALSAVTELSAGVYLVDFAAGDLNGNTIVLKATATGADTRLITLVTQP